MRIISKILKRVLEANLTIRCFFNGRGLTPFEPALAFMIALAGGGCCCFGVEAAAAAAVFAAESSCSRFLPRACAGGSSTEGGGIGGRPPGWATTGLGVATLAGTGVGTECVADGVGALAEAAGVTAVGRGCGIPAFASLFSSFCGRGSILEIGA